MQIIQHQSLQSYNTLGFAVRAEHFVDARSNDDIAEATAWARQRSMPIWVLGGGSNIVLQSDIHGLVIHVANSGITLQTQTDASVELEIAAGENWHGLVQHCLAHDYFGIENLTSIPGNVGAAPIQNIGAYGVELSEVFSSLRALDLHTGERIKLSHSDCRFSYRDSVFKHELQHTHIITDVTLALKRRFTPVLDYGDLHQRLAKSGCEHPSAKQLSELIDSIRRSKLPDPAQLGNAGSFFTNPVIERAQYDDLQAQFPELVGFPIDNGQCKVAAGWLVEQCGWRGYRQGDGVGVHDRQALVLVNHGDGNGAALLSLAERIRASVQEKFGIALQIEPRVI